MNIKSWIQGIGKKSPSPDALSRFDQSIDSSIGGLGDNMEKMYNSQRSVPLFEFRDMFDIQTSGIEGFMKTVDSTIQDLHKNFANPPKKGKRDVSANCTIPSTTAKSSSTTPTPTQSPDADSCDVSYKFLWDQFEVRGKNFDPTKFGRDGDGLKKQIKGCGDLTDWNSK